MSPTFIFNPSLQVVRCLQGDIEIFQRDSRLKSYKLFNKIFDLSSKRQHKPILLTMSAQPQSSSAVKTLTTQLQEIKDAVQQGHLTEEEGLRMRARVIDGPSPSKDHDKEDLAKYFREAELRTHQLWRREFEKFTTIKETWLATSLETKRAMFVDKAKAKNLNPTEAMLAIYLLYGGETELEFLRSLLVSSSGSLRLMMHNMYVASSCDASFLHSFGDRVIKLSEPLFPHTADFTAMNTVMIDDVDVGGGPEKRSFFKVPDDNDPLGGGPTHFYLQTDPEGQHYTDMTVVEQTVGNLQRQLGSVQAALDKAMAKIGKPASSGNGKPWYSKNNKGKNNNHNNYTSYNNNGYPNQNSYQQSYQNNYQNNHQPNQQNHQQQFQQPAPYYNGNGKGNMLGAGEPLQQPPTTSARKN